MISHVSWLKDAKRRGAEQEATEERSQEWVTEPLCVFHMSAEEWRGAGGPKAGGVRTEE